MHLKMSSAKLIAVHNIFAEITAVYSNVVTKQETNLLSKRPIFSDLIWPIAQRVCRFGCQWFSGPHDDVIKWKHFPRYWPFVLEIHRSPVNNMNPGYFPLVATALKPQQISMFLHISARAWGRRWSPHTSEQKGSMLNRNNSSIKTPVCLTLHIHEKHFYKFHPYKSVWYVSHAEHFISN